MWMFRPKSRDVAKKGISQKRGLLLCWPLGVGGKLSRRRSGRSGIGCCLLLGYKAASMPLSGCAVSHECRPKISAAVAVSANLTTQKRAAGAVDRQDRGLGGAQRALATGEARWRRGRCRVQV